ncbi:uncharacterized protein LOC135962439 [Calliphora vicina]|uniref:uncharacterized protein LOC135962439 n=1 Tax=Calliphora vicina TaxID=7373 RepID=UPI00325B4E0B
MEGFNYVVKPPQIPRVAFGSGMERETLPLQGPCLTSFMRQHQGDVFLSPGPMARVDERDHMEIKYPSKLGYTAFASKLLRLPAAETSNNPCVGTYDVEIKIKERKAFKPFNVGAQRSQKHKFLTPAPNTYSHHKTRKQLHISSAFGRQRKITPEVQIICSPLNNAHCHKCEQVPQGDYWRNYEEDLDLCRPCLHKIEQKLKTCSSTEVQRLRLRRFLLPYRLVRYCGFYHDHHGTTAATQLITTKILKFKINKENYLAMYM